MKLIREKFLRTRFAHILLFNIVFTILLPLIIRLNSDTLTPTEGIMIGFGIFVVLSFTEILYYIKELRRDNRNEDSIWQARSKFEYILKDLRENFSAVMQARHSEHDHLFEDLILKDITQLNEEVKDAAYKHTFPVKDHHFHSHNNLKEIFRDTDTNVYRELFILNSASGTFDYIYNNFFKMIAGMVGSKDLVVRTLFVRDPKEEGFADTIGIQNLLNYYANTKGFENRVIRQHNLTLLKPEYKVDGDWLDFGIFGDHLIFMTQKYPSSDGATDGLFLKRPEEVQKFIEFFDKVWADTRVLLPKEPRTISLDEVFETSS